MNGIFKFAAVNCDENPDICTKEGVKKFPTVRIYPPLPVPVFDYEVHTILCEKSSFFFTG